MLEILKIQEIFASGKFPKHNYILRDKKYEEKITEYLEIENGKCLTIHGPSKSGKTVTVEKILERDLSIWVKGQNIRDIDNFYQLVLDQLESFTEVSSSSTRNLGITTGINAGLFKFQLQSSSSTASTTKRVVSDLTTLERELEAKPVPIVIDDFHFIPSSVQRDISLAIKSLIAITSVVIITIPEISLAELRSISDMDSRVIDIQIEHWSQSELQEIGKSGFNLLNVESLERSIESFSKHSYGSPFLMQDMCKKFGYKNLGLRETLNSPRSFSNTVPNTDFFTEIAESNKPGIFAKLLKGKNVRGKPRKNKTFKFGDRIYNADVYSFVMLELRNTEIESTSDVVSLDEIYRNLKTKQKLDADSEEKPLKSQDISKCLKSMSEIADLEKGDSDPAILYQDQKLQIIDPNLINYIRNSDWAEKNFVIKENYYVDAK